MASSAGCGHTLHRIPAAICDVTHHIRLVGISAKPVVLGKEETMIAEQRARRLSIMLIGVLVAGLVFAALPTPIVHAQSTDDGFNASANNIVSALVVQSNGQIIVGGSFTMLNGQPRNRIGRLNPDGSLDPAFNPGANGKVVAIAAQPDGKMIVGGQFTELGGQPRNYIGRLNSDGSIDPGFDPGADSWIFALAIQPDGKVVAGGNFSTLGGEPRPNIGRIANDIAALQSLEVDPASGVITWRHSGASPEVWYVTFALSTDGAAYTPLGAGTRIHGGWRLGGLTLPHGRNVYIRARVTYSTGDHGGSCSIADSVWNIYIRYTAQLPLVTRE
jgi:uncharacterized delta-60 repeat protein